ncbi:glycosyltransferase family 2 protein [Neiella sp. HB171785]|uniref:Glycosyltransferase family 2 protein n=2 Tax=Neiella litorisoli TaxID=2771431 RepID=A0A8J6QR06_9GAMM|nr:glycosyltransferase family 2 protein [Neiella litorisoli]
MLAVAIDTSVGDARKIQRTVASLARGQTECIKCFILTNAEVASVQQELSELNALVAIEYLTSLSAEKLELEGFDFVTLLACGDELSERCVLELSVKSAVEPAASLIYADADRLNGDKQRCMPSFFPEWNPDFFLSANYFKQNCFWNVSTLKREEHKTSINWHNAFALSLACVASGQSIKHIAKVLFHRNAIEDPLNASQYNAEIEWLREFLGEQISKVERNEFANTFRVCWSLPQQLPKVSIIIPTRNAKSLVQTCIESILEKTDYPNFEILLVDNQSDEPQSLTYFAELNEHPLIRVIQYQYPFNYSAINNYAVNHCDGEVIALVNNDIEVINDDWLTEMVSHALRPNIGAVGAKLFYSDGMIQHAGVIIGFGGVAGHAHKNFPMKHAGYLDRLQSVQNFSAVTAACLVVKRTIYEQVGGLNEDDLTVAFNDVDFCLKVQKAGYWNLWTPYAQLYHHESVSRGTDQTGEKRKRFMAEIDYMKSTWKTDRFNDPAYSPHLTLKREDFSVAESEPVR